MKIHIIGICGAMTTPIAVSLKQTDNQVTGSDQHQIYPPYSTLLQKHKIKINQQKINSTIDLVIVGSSYKAFANCIKEFETVKKLRIPYISATKYLAKNIIKDNSILIAGSYGKTTITGTVINIFRQLNIDTSYFIGGQMIDNSPSIHFSPSNWSICEADESINGLDTMAKFLYYPVKYLLLTSASWEHKDSYASREDNFQSFKKLVTKIPTNGLLVYNPDDKEIQRLLPFCKSKKIPYQNFKYKTKLIGYYNQQNVNAAITLCQSLNLNLKEIIASATNFQGIKRRLEIIGSIKDIIIIDDYAQSPNRVQAAIQAISETYPKYKIKTYFEPRASFLQNQTSLIGFDQAFKLSSEIVLGKLNFSKNIDKLNRVTIANWQNIVGAKLHYLPINQAIIDHYSSSLNRREILIHFSSGGIDGLNNLNKIIKNIKRGYNSI